MAVAFRSVALGVLPSAGGDTGGGATVVPYPAGIVAGDLLLIHLDAVPGGAYSTPAGWTLLFGPIQMTGATAFYNYMYVLYKIAAGGESGSVSIPTGGNGFGVMSAYSGVDPATPIDAYATTANIGAGTSKTAPSVTTTTETMVLRLFCPNGSSAVTATTPAGGTTERYSLWSNWDNGRLELADQLQAVAGASGTATVTFAGSITDGASATIALRAAPSTPLSQFSGTPLGGASPLSVAFTDLSTGSPTSWSWDFGDGATSTAQNPTHVYASGGTYTVTLVATNGFGAGTTQTKTGYVTADIPTYRSGATYDSGGSQTTTVVLPKPVGTAVGDVLVVLVTFLFGLDNNTRTIAPPDGSWTQIQRFTDPLSGSYVCVAELWWKIAGASEPSSYTFTISASDASYNGGVIAAFMGASPPEASAKLYASGAGDVVQTPSVTGLGVNRLDLRYALSMYLAHTHGPPSGYTLNHTFTLLGGANQRLSMASKLQAAAAAYGAQNFSAPGLGTSGSQAGFSAVLPPSVPPPVFVPKIVIS